jgi:hypothetical protein
LPAGAWIAVEAAQLSLRLSASSTVNVPIW